MQDKQTVIEFQCDKATTVSIAGDWNEWCGSARGAFDPRRGAMERAPGNRFLFPVRGIGVGRHEFKFVIDGEWETGGNRVFHLDARGRLVDPSGGIERVVALDPFVLEVRFSPLARSGRPVLDLLFQLSPRGTITGRQLLPGRAGQGDRVRLRCRDLDLTQSVQLMVHGLGDETVRRSIHLDTLFKSFYFSRQPLGPSLEGEPPVTVVRLFAPRASKVTLELFDDAQMTCRRAEVRCSKDVDGVWAGRVAGTHWGRFYTFRVEGPVGDGNAFNPEKRWQDPYARAGVFHNGPSILIDPAAEPGGFTGWTDQNFRIPDKRDLVIYEASVRDLTSHESARVEPAQRGKFLGLAATPGTGVGLDHIKAVGANAVEFLPLQEFDDDPPGAYHWGYMTSLFFAPEASYATRPDGAQVGEFKTLVNTMHAHDIAVIMDVVYNHTGAPFNFDGIDRHYYYRLDNSFTKLNFSGCGNDFNTENPMVRRLILDSLEMWVREYHVDGFRFDLGELIDDETLRQIEARLTAIKPGIILISEPWSFRGSHKGRFRNTHWSMWNDDFRNRVKEVAQGKVPVHDVVGVLNGSVTMWAAHPLESVNYVESHDDFTLIDHLTVNAGRDGREPTPIDVRRHLFCGALTLIAPGIPMLAQGQEMLRSKGGNGNSYNAGDAVNTIDYGLVTRRAAAFSFYRGLLALRRSRVFEMIRHADAELAARSVWLPGERHSVGGLLWSRADGGEQLLVLLNNDVDKAGTVEATLPTGRWRRMVGDDKVFAPAHKHGLEVTVAGHHGRATGTAKFAVPPMSVELWWRAPDHLNH